MPPPADPSEPSTATRSRAEVVERFRRDWRQRGPVALDAYLPAPGSPARRALLLELLPVEWELRIARGEAIRVEDAAARYPELGPVRGLPAELIYEEYSARRRHGQDPTLDEYRTRFPDQFAELQRIVRDRHLDTMRTTPREATPTPADSSRPSRRKTDPPQVRTRGDSSPDHVPVGDLAYRKLGRLGRGTFGEVFLAEAPGGVRVALKCITRPITEQECQRELEALELVKNLHHPYLLSTYTFWAVDDKLVIVMELADGSLADRLRECKEAGLAGIPAEELIAYFEQAALAIDFVHEHGVIHRDIKPANLLRLQGIAKVADFGLAREQSGDLSTATFAGTPAYMAPEIYRGQVGRHSDQFSLAVTYAELRTGRRVFDAKDPFTMARLITLGEPDLSGLSPAEQKVLRRALQKEPEDRYPSCSAFAHALAEAVRPRPAAVGGRRLGLFGMVMFVGFSISLGVLLAVGAVLLRHHLWQPEPWLPPGFQPAEGAARVQLSGRSFYDRIERPIAGADPAVFLLIAEHSGHDPRPFYMMRDKVTNAQFAAAWQSRDKPDERLRELMLKHTAQNRYPQAVPGNWKDLGLQPKYGPLPVMNVTVTEAHCFAEWLGGVLPSGEQWDEAGGKAAALDGPLPSSASPVGRLGILPWTRDAHRLGPAVGVVAYVDELPFVGPLPAGTCPADTARSGCRDLAGNGKEFTRDVTVAVGVLNPPPVPLPVPDAGAMVALRGRTFLAYKPFRFRDADPKYPDAMWYNGSDPDLGFRVVVPIPDPSPATGNGPAGR